MKCGFYREAKECTEKCQYFNTCTKNPNRKERIKDGRCKVDKDNNRCV